MGLFSGHSIWTTSPRVPCVGPCVHQVHPSFSIPSVTAHQQITKPASQELHRTAPHMCTHSHTCTYNHAHTCVFMSNAHKHIHTQPHSVTQARTDTAVHVCMYVCMNIHNYATCEHERAHTGVGIHSYANTHIHRHLQICTSANMHRCVYNQEPQALCY